MERSRQRRRRRPGGPGGPDLTAAPGRGGADFLDPRSAGADLSSETSWSTWPRHRTFPAVTAAVNLAAVTTGTTFATATLRRMPDAGQNHEAAALARHHCLSGRPAAP